ncbi:MAG: nitroreductase family protein [Bifidobacteriaceae bacterium]|jgi:nitroreductase|nr:nitroreductase family protein [Bifidobacteriaceae bacterium]
MPTLNRADLSAAIRNRFAIREYDKDNPVSPQDLDFILEAAHLAPSSMGLQHWNLLVITDHALWDKLKPVAGGLHNSLDGASHLVIFTVVAPDRLRPGGEHTLGLWRAWGHKGESLERRRSNLEAFLRENHKIRTDREVIDWAARQAYIALGSLIQAAALVGVDSCAIEGWVPAEVNRVLSEAGVIDLSHELAVVGVVLGHRAGPPDHERRRRPKDEVIRFVRGA